MSNHGRHDSQHPLTHAVAANYDRIGPPQRKVIDRLLHDTRYAAVVSAPEIALELDVSESTVTRSAGTWLHGLS